MSIAEYSPSRTFEDIPTYGEVDLRDLQPEQVVSFLEMGVQKYDWLLHGSARHYLYLKPQPAHDLYREEGRRTAIYATTIVPQALYAAIFNSRLRGSLRTLYEGFNRTLQDGEPKISPPVCGFNSLTGKDGKYMFTSYMYEHIINGGTDLTQDGVVCALPRQSFIQETNSGIPHADWQSEEAVVPVAIYIVSRNVGKLLFQPAEANHPLYEARSFTPEEEADHARQLGWI